MVKLTVIKFFSNKPFLKKKSHIEKKFVDSIVLTVKGGNGGSGNPITGGIGGDGGNIVFEGKSKLKCLSELLYKKFEAENGEESKKNKFVGVKGKDKIINVPFGTLITHSNDSVIGEINNEDDKIILPIGGEGGKILNKFIPRKGETLKIKVDMKLISDVGLIGYPNAGKSTLLKSLSRAKPKIANYPFTTLEPQIGTIEYDDLRSITIADLPGLVKDAHKNKGLGHKFLKHILRTNLLIFVVSANLLNIENEQIKNSNTLLLHLLLSLLKEIELYNETILEKPSILVISQMDTPNSKNRYLDLINNLKKLNVGDLTNLNLSDDIIPAKIKIFDKIIPISCKTSFNIYELKNCIRDVLDDFFEQKQISNNKIKTFTSISNEENLEKEISEKYTLI